MRGTKGKAGKDKAAKDKAPITPPCSMAEALLLFMNDPHPLTMLSAYGSYGTNGAISRFHNPDNYTKGLSHLLQIQEHQAQEQ